MYQENHWARAVPRQGPPPAQLIQLLQEHRKQLRSVDAHLSPWLTRALTFRHILRQVQGVTALHQLLGAEPDLPAVHAQHRVHERLFEIYWGMGYYDAAVDHLREQVHYTREAAAAKEDIKLKKYLHDLEERLADCEKQLNDLQRAYELVAAGLSPRVQAHLAFRPFGLAKQALAGLMKEMQENPEQNKPDDANLVVYLHLTLGKAEEMRGQLTEDWKPLMGPYSYEIHLAVQAAAVGDYAKADEHLGLALEEMPKASASELLAHMLNALTMGRLQPYLLTQQTLAPYLQAQLVGAAQTFLALRHKNELLVLRGLLALEAGDTRAAREHFHQAVEGPAAGSFFESRPIAERYLSLLRAAKGRE
jgi:tetratricopeptide (TPR) repeat protein